MTDIKGANGNAINRRTAVLRTVGMAAAALSFMAIAAGCGGCGIPAADFSWETNEYGGATITSYARQSKVVKIPAKFRRQAGNAHREQDVQGK
jgi:hypothetical protein